MKSRKVKRSRRWGLEGSAHSTASSRDEEAGEPEMGIAWSHLEIVRTPHSQAAGLIGSLLTWVLWQDEKHKLGHLWAVVFSESQWSGSPFPRHFSLKTQGWGNSAAPRGLS